MNHGRMKRGDALNGNSHISLQPRFDFLATLAVKSRLRIAVGFSERRISFLQEPFRSQIHSFLTHGSAEQGRDGTEERREIDRQHSLKSNVFLLSRPKRPRWTSVRLTCP